MRRRVSIFGATGSVGRNSVAVIEGQGGAEAYDIVALTGAGNVALLAEQARRLGARIAVQQVQHRLALLGSNGDRRPHQARTTVDGHEVRQHELANSTAQRAAALLHEDARSGGRVAEFERGPLVDGGELPEAARRGEDLLDQRSLVCR